MIQTINLSKTFKNGVTALHDITLDVEAGEFIFLTGQSGAGKSTLIRLLFREVMPSSGQIIIGGRSILRLSGKEVVRLRRNTGVIFQDFRLMEKNTVYDNVAFAMKAVERSPEEIASRVPKVLDRVGLINRINSTVETLSGGEQQRVAVARAIINNPVIIFADEPTGDLDPQTSGELMQLLSEINQEGTTIVMATHDKNIVDVMHKRVITLSGGRLISDEVGGFKI
ncbi:MAG: cell division ATP-binding protein FtsE [Bacillota bacterium]